MKKTILVLFLAALCYACQTGRDQIEARHQLEETNKAIEAAFAKGDVDEIMKYHHPDVSKVFNYDDAPKYFEEVKNGLLDLITYNEVAFGENEIESLIINKETAILQTKFVLKGKVKESGEAWEYRGRTMVISVKYDQSPTGWATLREIVQPAP